MSFSVSADAYDRFMGRYSSPLAPLLADLAIRVCPERTRCRARDAVNSASCSAGPVSSMSRSAP